MRIIVALFISLFSFAAFAVVETYEFQNDVQRKRYHQFVDELRCPKCQNQNLDGSNAEIARDLRRELHEQITAGRSDTEIVHFMVERYGDFILYKPRVNAKTFLLWAAPALFLLLGGGIAFSVYRRQRQPAAENDLESSPLSEQEQQRLQQLLKEKP